MDEPQPTPAPGQVYDPTDQPDATERSDSEAEASELVAGGVDEVDEAAPAPSDQPLISWEASEYIHHDKRFGWYLIFFVVIAGLIAAAAITHQWLTIGVFVVMAGAMMVYANKQPRVLKYSLSERGLTIDQKFYDYSAFRSFSVLQDLAWHLIDLDPIKRFMPRLSVMFEDTNRDAIVELLGHHLPRQDRQPDFVERAARFLRF